MPDAGASSPAASRAGFTLVELLVTISIIALLLAILLPALAAARDRARSMMCRSHLRQIAMAFEIYGEEHQGVWPRPYRAAGGGVSQDSSWHRDEIFPVIYPTARPRPHWRATFDESIFRCPNWAHSAVSLPAGPFTPGDEEYDRRSYGMNGMLPDAKDQAHVPHPWWRYKDRHQVKRPARTLLLADSLTPWLAVVHVDSVPVLRLAARRHAGQVHVVMADLSLRPMSPDDMPLTPDTEALRVFWQGMDQ